MSKSSDYEHACVIFTFMCKSVLTFPIFINKNFMDFK